MSAKLFKNTEGKVLMSAGGKLIKQSYEFGNAFQNRMGLNNYMKFDLTGVAQYYSALVCWRNITASYNTPLFSLKNTNNDNYNFGADLGGASNVGMQKNATSNNNMGTQAMIFTNTIGRIMWLGCYIGQVMPYSLFSSGEFTQSISVETNNFPLLSGWIGAGRYANGSLPSYYAPNVKFSRFILLDRKWTLPEHRYLYNNANGNDPQSNLGIIVDIHCNFAEILDFSTLQDGSDMRIGCRDYSGFNRHGEIINIPAGIDLEVKLAWANTNLFVDFLS